MTALPRLAIAGSAVTISRIGFGCGRIHGGDELKSSRKLIEAALAAGIRHFDTAPSYGDGTSEAALGEVLAGMTDVTIATKIGGPVPGPISRTSSAKVLYRRWLRPLLGRIPSVKARLLALMDHGESNAPERSETRRTLGHDEVRRGLENSLKKLRRDRIDILLVHEPDRIALTDALRDTLQGLQRDGTIGAFGLAWGRYADPAAAMGTVVQARYGPGSMARPGETRIFHGVLRHASADMTRVVPAARIGAILEAHSDAAIIFSASQVGQIRDIVAGSPSGGGHA